MDEEDEEIYGPGTGSAQIKHEINESNGDEYNSRGDAMEESEDNTDVDSDSDIDIITERAPGTTQTEPTVQARAETVKQEQVKLTSGDQKPAKRQAGQKKESIPRQSSPRKLGTEYPEFHTSSVDVDANPIYEPVGKPVTDIDFDADLAEQEKPWRRPGSDQSDWFNYGFDEFTWATYCLKQKNMREEQETESAQIKMMLGGGMPGMPSGPNPQSGPPQASQNGPMTGAMPGMPGMPGVPEMTPDMMNQMMQQMMANGMDPSQMDLNMFAQQFGQMMGGPPTGPGGQSSFPAPPGMDNIGGISGQEGGRSRQTGGNFQNRGRGRRW